MIPIWSHINSIFDRKISNFFLVFWTKTIYFAYRNEFFRGFWIFVGIKNMQFLPSGFVSSFNKKNSKPFLQKVSIFVQFFFLLKTNFIQLVESFSFAKQWIPISNVSVAKTISKIQYKIQKKKLCRKWAINWFPCDKIYQTSYIRKTSSIKSQNL